MRTWREPIKIWIENPTFSVPVARRFPAVAWPKYCFTELQHKPTVTLETEGMVQALCAKKKKKHLINHCIQFKEAMSEHRVKNQNIHNAIRARGKSKNLVLIKCINRKWYQNRTWSWNMKWCLYSGSRALCCCGGFITQASSFFSFTKEKPRNVTWCLGVTTIIIEQQIDRKYIKVYRRKGSIPNVLYIYKWKNNIVCTLNICTVNSINSASINHSTSTLSQSDLRYAAKVILLPYH